MLADDGILQKQIKIRDISVRMYEEKKLSPEPIERPDHIRRHQMLLVLALGILIGAFLLEVRDDGRVAFRWGTDRVLPQLCAMRSWVGIDCPACGLTRSLIHLSHSDWRSAWEDHHLGWLIFIAVLVQLPYRFYALRTRQDEPLGYKVPLIYWNGLIVLLMANWMVGFLVA